MMAWTREDPRISPWDGTRVVVEKSSTLHFIYRFRVKLHIMGTTSLEVVPNQVMKLKLNTALHMWPRGVHPELEIKTDH
jgi:hypothetical protein